MMVGKDQKAQPQRALERQWKNRSSSLQTCMFSDSIRMFQSDDVVHLCLPKCPGESMAHVPQDVCANTFKAAAAKQQKVINSSNVHQQEKG